jgi:hypothetical protein
LSLQSGRYFGTLHDVSRLIAVCFLFLFLSPVRAQEQERKLIDRLLRPDMSLQNSEQKKKFMANKTLVDKPAHVSAFYLQKKSSARDFRATRDFSTQRFAAQSSNSAQAKTANISSRTTPPDARYATPSRKQLSAVHDASKRRQTNTFSGNRPFLDEGKSQKSLSRKNPPLTIEQVRELLNKNK